MYIPRPFHQQQAGELHGLMRAHPLATLVIDGDQGLTANHVPLQFAAAAGAHGVLRGHVARANPVWREAVAGCPALALFHGPNAYVSPGWYPSKRDDPRVVPTWNYAVVHVHGTLTAVEDRTWLRAQVAALTVTHEAPRPEPWQVDDAPPDYVEQLLDAIVGLELTVTRIEGKWKLSQNRPPADRAGVAAGLRAEAGPAGADLAELVVAAITPGRRDA